MPNAQPRPDSPDRQPPRLTTASIMRGSKELEIDHGGRIYRLRITASGKLILTG